MCGFFLSQKNIGDMSSKLLKHRGPDDYKVYEDKYLKIENYRLSIVDQNKSNTHPTLSRSGNTLITFNGEIYNYLDLKKKYKLKPLIHSEAHIIAEFFDKFGIKKLNEMNGMFALIFYNLKTKEVFLFRDRFGIKPLNYTLVNNNIYAASEIKPLLHLRKNKKLKNDIILKDSIINFLYRARINHDKYSFFKDIYSVLPGHYLLFKLKNNKYIQKRYYFFKKKKIKNKKYLGSLEDILKKKIKLFSITKRKSGILLSGGVDSTLISALTKKSRSNILSFTYGFNRKGVKDFSLVDDTVSSKKISKELKIKNYHTFVSPDYIIKNFDKVLKVIETPFTSIRIFGMYKVYAFAKSKGYSMIIDGQGGDEVFGGYKHHMEYAGKTFLKKNMTKILNEKIENGLLKDGANFIFENLFSKKLQDFKRKYKNTSWTKNFNNNFNKNSLMQNSQIEDILMNTIPRSLHYVDRLSMASSIEARLPLLDNDIVDYGINVPDLIKSDNIQSRKIIKEILKKYIFQPVDIKKYVADPQTTWMRTYLKDFVLKEFNSNFFKKNDLFNSSEVNKAFKNFVEGSNIIPSYTFFVILSLNRFMKLFKVRVD